MNFITFWLGLPCLVASIFESRSDVDRLRDKQDLLEKLSQILQATDLVPEQMNKAMDELKAIDKKANEMLKGHPLMNDPKKLFDQFITTGFSGDNKVLGTLLHTVGAKLPVWEKQVLPEYYRRYLKTREEL